MKKNLIIIIFTYAIVTANAQSFNTYADTANYLIHTIENNKSQYVGKPFSVLLSDFLIKPVRVIPGNLEKENFGKDPTFYFNNEREFSKKHFITIDFESVPPYDTLYPIFFPSTGLDADFNQIINTYKPLIIKDVSVKDYTNDDDYPIQGINYPSK